MASPYVVESHTRINTTGLGALPEDILYLMVREFIPNPKHIAKMSQTCRRLSHVLEPLLYRADVLWTKREDEPGDVHSSWPPMIGLFRKEDRTSTGGWSIESRRSVQHLSALQWAVSKSDTSLRTAVARKAIRAAKFYWPGYLDVFYETWGVVTPLQLAAKYGMEDTVRELVEAGASIDARTRHDPIMHADQCPFLKRFDTRDEPEWPYNTVNALWLAIWCENVRVAEFLAERSEDPGDDWKGGLATPPMVKLAAYYKMPSVIKILRSRQYESNDSYGILKGTRALELAAANDNNEETLKYFLDRGEGSVERSRAIYWACKFGCAANLMFLANYAAPESRVSLAAKYMGSLLSSDKFLPAVQLLIGDNPMKEEQSREISNMLDTVTFRFFPTFIIELGETPQEIERRTKRNANIWAPQMVRYLLAHPNLQLDSQVRDNVKDYLEHKEAKTEQDPEVCEDTEESLDDESSDDEPVDDPRLFDERLEDGYVDSRYPDDPYLKDEYLSNEYQEYLRSIREAPRQK
ncbi:hypothetical protein M426DRAFT_103631 [Hypoxylon sp. CI-4A]|nr:hypothetical protein M426DRAFT_103631 [Hypoxylon sp. CI-4A]